MRPEIRCVEFIVEIPRERSSYPEVASAVHNIEQINYVENAKLSLTGRHIHVYVDMWKVRNSASVGRIQWYRELFSAIWERLQIAAGNSAPVETIDLTGVDEEIEGLEERIKQLRAYQKGVIE